MNVLRPYRRAFSTKLHRDHQWATGEEAGRNPSSYRVDVGDQRGDDNRKDSRDPRDRALLDVTPVYLRCGKHAVLN